MSDVPSLASILDESTPTEVAAPEKTEITAPETPAAPEGQIREPTRREIIREKEAAAQAEGEGKVRDPVTGKFVAKTEEAAPPASAKPVAAPPVQEMTEKERAFLRVAQEERTKRQEIERRLAALEKPPEKPKEFWEDPEGAVKALRDEVANVATTTRLNTAEAIARSRYQDFDEKIKGTFAKLVGEEPGLYQKMLGAADPAEFAYRYALNHERLESAGDLGEFQKKIEADTETRLRAKIEAEYKAKAEAAAKERAALPGSLSDAKGTQQNRQVWGGPPSLDEILTS